MRSGKASMEVIEENMGDELYKKTYDSAMASMKQIVGRLDRDVVGCLHRQRDRILG
jgi:hypothetical protein